MSKKVSPEYEDLFMLTREEVEEMRNDAQNGDEQAAIAYANWLVWVDDNDADSYEKARLILEELYKGGSMEAASALYELCFKGLGGPVDRERAARLLDESLAAGCEYAYRKKLRNMVFGLRGMKADPQQALDDVLAAIALREEQDLPSDPWLTYYRGCAVEQLQNRTAALPFFEEAAQGGVIRAWLDVAVAYGYGDDTEMEDQDVYMRWLAKGAGQGNAECAFLYALESMSDYENLPMFTRLFALKDFFLKLRSAYRAGAVTAAVILGDIYYNGEYDQEVDMYKAWTWYEKAAKKLDLTALEKMFAMIKHGKVERSQEEADEIALLGARLESKYLLGETVIAFTQGRLQEHADEISRYYEPIFDSDDFCDGWSAPDNDTWVHIDDDDLPDDDGRFDAYS